MTGISVKDFFIGCFTLFAVSQNCLFVERYLTKPKSIVFEKNEWDKFWPLVCKTFSGFRQACKKYDLRSDLYEKLMCIEAKGNEDSLILDKEKLVDIVQHVIGKAVCQCHDLWVRTHKDQVGSIKENHKNCTPLIVTFKSFDFANSKFYRQEVVGSMRNDRCQDSFSHCVNRYQVIDIRSFEHLISIAICSKVSLHEILEKKNTQGLEDDW